MDKQTLEEERFEIDRLTILDCSKLKFYKDEGNFISLYFELYRLQADALKFIAED